LVAIDRGTNGLLDPRPQSATATTDYYSITPDGFFETANYIGAFAPASKSGLWTDGWTYLDQFGYTADVVVADAPSNVSTSLSGTNLTVSWDSVPGAVSYSVYSCDTPNGTFTLETTVGTNQWTATATDSKKFYYIKTNTAK
ncbi:MAG: hypothetical protein JXR69_07120, partial [Candidatus Delongbacteria bacterium]|nr:hypothetical protein [Candidatus Delongbacteria bacterium]